MQIELIRHKDYTFHISFTSNAHVSGSFVMIHNIPQGSSLLENCNKTDFKSSNTLKNHPVDSYHTDY